MFVIEPYLCNEFLIRKRLLNGSDLENWKLQLLQRISIARVAVTVTAQFNALSITYFIEFNKEFIVTETV